MSAIAEAVTDMMGMFEEGQAAEQVDALADVVRRIGAAAKEVGDASLRAQVEEFARTWTEAARIRDDVGCFVDAANTLSAELGSEGYLAG